MSVEILTGDCRAVLAQMGPDSFDACVTDPPYGLEFMSVAWDTFAKPKGGSRVPNKWNDHGSREHPRDARGQARVQRNKGLAFQKFCDEWAREVYRVLKPGAYLLAFGGTRTYHRLACAIEDAGFEIRETIMYMYGSGFPKSLDVSKAIDRARDDHENICRVALWLRPYVERTGFDVVTAHFGFKDETMARARWTSKSQPNVPTWEQWLQLKALCDFGDEMDAEVWRLNGRKGTPGEAWFDREVVGRRSDGAANGSVVGLGSPRSMDTEYDETAPATEAARQWQGWGTSLKPACEPIVVARKPLDPRPLLVDLTPEVLATWEAKRCDRA